MKRGKLFTFLSIIILICLFAVAASCSLCGVPINIGETTDTTDESAEEGRAEQGQTTQSRQTQQESPEQSQPAEEVTEPEPEEEEAADVIPEEEPEPEALPNNPPEIIEIIIVGPVSGEPITANYLYTDEEYEIRVEAFDPDGDILSYEWVLGWSREDYGLITDNNSSVTTWVTPSNEVGGVWLYIKVTDESGEYDEDARQLRIVIGASI